MFLTKLTNRKSKSSDQKKSFSRILPPPNIQSSSNITTTSNVSNTNTNRLRAQPAIDNAIGSSDSPNYQRPEYSSTTHQSSNSVASQSSSTASPSIAPPPTRPAVAEVEGNAVVKSTLIVGIDFGTTNSGVAFAWATGTEAKEDIISEWPGLGNMTKFKIPTVLYYDSHGNVVGWGSDAQGVLNAAGFPRPGIQKVEWFKLHLQRNYRTYVDPSRLPPLPAGKSEIDIAADYLSRLRDAMRKELEKKLGEIFLREEQNIQYFLTVPAIWDDAGKATTRLAAVKAGFVKDVDDRRLSLITEPEAAAIFCAKRGVLELKEADTFLIVDCGGGTVDLIAYEVEDENPFTVRECTKGTGDACGSTAVDVSFLRVVKARVDRIVFPPDLSNDKIKKFKDKIYRRCREDFERIKVNFVNKPTVDWTIDIGLEIDSVEADIVEGNMTFSNDEILSAFSLTVARIVELVRDQIVSVEAQHKRLQAILVVGGFGASTYLFDQLKLQIPPSYSNKLRRPMDSVAAIVRGAVVTGIYERVLVSRVARKHYLMATLQPFIPGTHPEEYKVPSLDGTFKCKHTRQVFVQKGQQLKIGQTIKISFFRQVAVGSSLLFEDRLYTSDEDICPMFTTDPKIKVMVVLTSDLSTVPTSFFETCSGPDGDTFYKIFFDILLTLDGGNEMRADLVFGGKVMGHVRSRFG
ncbi:hypothetical protein V1514DRAFT_324579 [Lipomyces japonicus]|uniref:uncharacterized protein n=1 Tax=Lipomyces japonicus TaxID=56871 RepID=UPI0034CFE18C